MFEYIYCSLKSWRSWFNQFFGRTSTVSQKNCYRYLSALMHTGFAKRNILSFRYKQWQILLFLIVRIWYRGWPISLYETVFRPISRVSHRYMIKPCIPFTFFKLSWNISKESEQCYRRTVDFISLRVWWIETLTFPSASLMTLSRQYFLLSMSPY